MSEKYAYRPGSRGRVDAQTAGEELERIRESNGGLTASVVVDQARPKTAPLHPAFTWDNKAAGEQWRLHEARNLIRSVQVVTEAHEPKPKYVHVRRSKEDAAYEDVQVVVQSPDLFTRALSDLHARMLDAQRAVRALEHAAESISDEDKLARLTLAIRAVTTAAEAVRALH